MLFDKILRDIHLGINPVNGGIPLKDKRSKGIINIKSGVCVEDRFMVFLILMFLI